MTMDVFHVWMYSIHPWSRPMLIEIQTFFYRLWSPD